RAGRRCWWAFDRSSTSFNPLLLDVVTRAGCRLLRTFLLLLLLLRRLLAAPAAICRAVFLRLLLLRLIAPGLLGNPGDVDTGVPATPARRGQGVGHDGGLGDGTRRVEDEAAAVSALEDEVVAAVVRRKPL
ncbi:unnamed protein product, partial [Ectocarpus sp. 12 AP-2014]